MTHYLAHIDLPPLGRSDHRIVWLTSNYAVNHPVGYRIIQNHHLNFNTINNIADELTKVHWPELYRTNDIQNEADLFYALLFEVINKRAPLRQV